MDAEHAVDEPISDNGSDPAFQGELLFSSRGNEPFVRRVDIY